MLILDNFHLKKNDVDHTASYSPFDMPVVVAEHDNLVDVVSVVVGAVGAVVLDNPRVVIILMEVANPYCVLYQHLLLPSLPILPF